MLQKIENMRSHARPLERRNYREPLSIHEWRLSESKSHIAALQKPCNILDITGFLRLALCNSCSEKSAHPELIEVPYSVFIKIGGKK